MATEGHELDLATQSVTKLTTIARFAAALGKVLERPDIGAKLADGCAAEGVVNVGALRGLGYDAQLELYSTCGLGNLFNNTINQFLGYAGEEQYTPQAPAPMGALGGGDGATPKSCSSARSSPSSRRTARTCASSWIQSSRVPTGLACAGRFRLRTPPE